jgi:LPS sulfotransferase NodH
MSEARADPIRFVILAVPRTGSNLLCTLLNSHPEVLCHHEVFNPTGIFYALEYRDGALNLGTIEERDRDPLAFLNRLWTARPGYRSVGFKFTRGQSEPVLQSVLSARAVRKIILRRGNRLKSYVSAKVAECTGQWEVYRETEVAPERPRVTVHLSELQRHLEETDRFYDGITQWLEITKQHYMLASYETLFESRAQRAILEFLGVKPLGDELQPKSVKQNPTDLRRLIANYEELDRELRGSDLEAELHSLQP